MSGRADELNGLKENVIMGRPIPAGTGLPRYKNIRVNVEEEALQEVMEQNEVAPTLVPSAAG